MSACCRLSEADLPPYPRHRAWLITAGTNDDDPAVLLVSAALSMGAAQGMGPEATVRDAVGSLLLLTTARWLPPPLRTGLHPILHPHSLPRPIQDRKARTPSGLWSSTFAWT